MKVTYLIIPSLAILAACSTPSKQLSDSDRTLLKIDSLESVLFSDPEAKADPRAGMQLIKEYAKYYQNMDTKDSLAVDMLFKAGEVSMGIGQGNLAVKYFKTISKDHVSFHKAPEALFLSGFCEENLNRDTAEARFFYEQFIKEYPYHKLAEDAKFSVQNMRLTDEQLIEMFEEKLKEQK
ncbi:MAG: hypothetical protein RL266_2525 [Bacteroidota bacterium]|jgi:hypothetical protein